MKPQVETLEVSAAPGVPADANPVETSEWLEALDEVIDEHGRGAWTNAFEINF